MTIYWEYIEEAKLESGIINTRGGNTQVASTLLVDSNLKEVTRIPKVASTPEVARIPKVASIPKVARIPKVANIPDVARIPRVASITIAIT
jgi:hypothetical protein